MDNRKPITVAAQKAYYAYFGIKLADQDELWAPHVVCKTCLEHSRQRTNETRKSIPQFNKLSDLSIDEPSDLEQRGCKELTDI